jgi:hypothetical protein
VNKPLAAARHLELKHTEIVCGILGRVQFSCIEHHTGLLLLQRHLMVVHSRHEGRELSSQTHFIRTSSGEEIRIICSGRMKALIENMSHDCLSGPLQVADQRCRLTRYGYCFQEIDSANPKALYTVENQV